MCNCIHMLMYPAMYPAFPLKLGLPHLHQRCQASCQELCDVRMASPQQHATATTSSTTVAVPLVAQTTWAVHRCARESLQRIAFLSDCSIWTGTCAHGSAEKDTGCSARWCHINCMKAFRSIQKQLQPGRLPSSHATGLSIVECALGCFRRQQLMPSFEHVVQDCANSVGTAQPCLAHQDLKADLHHRLHCDDAICMVPDCV
jgi:hypothetical protein